LIKAANNIVHAKELSEARRLLDGFLHQMPAVAEEYSNPNNFQFVKNLKASASRQKS